MFKQNMYLTFQNEVNQRGGLLWVCGVNRTNRYHGKVILVKFLVVVD
jgi:hypothetical protein